MSVRVFKKSQTYALLALVSVAGCQDLIENERQAKLQKERQAEILERRTQVGAAMKPLLSELGKFDPAKSKRATGPSTGGGGKALVIKRPKIDLEFVHFNSVNAMYATTPDEVSVVVNVYRLVDKQPIGTFEGGGKAFAVNVVVIATSYPGGERVFETQKKFMPAESSVGFGGGKTIDTFGQATPQFFAAVTKAALAAIKDGPPTTK